MHRVAEEQKMFMRDSTEARGSSLAPPEVTDPIALYRSHWLRCGVQKECGIWVLLMGIAMSQDRYHPQAPFKLTRTKTQTPQNGVSDTPTTQIFSHSAQGRVTPSRTAYKRVRGEWRLGWVVCNAAFLASQANNISSHVKREFEAALQCSTARFRVYA
ncbi:hypothetical protein EDB19DRAFT_1835011 [Suillus lakei]|nr:hypothetical protein EDB19DRAFT_1835011 [Suillus lakei]